jgi:SAM-dependent methyltransferase
VVSGSSTPGTRALDASPGRHSAANSGAANSGAANSGAANSGAANSGGRRRAGLGTGLFTQSVLDYAAHRPRDVISVLQFGCVTAAGDLDLAGGDARRYQFAVTAMDDDNAATRAAVERQPGLGQVILADLRTVPLTPRSVDVVHCCRLLDRISHTDILLSRLVDALRPGGLLLVRTADRQTAAGFLDRTMPRPLRALTWHRLRPGEPGPYPAVYEPLTSARGLQAFVTRHGLVISGREATSALATQRRPGIMASRALVSALTRGRLTAAHDELGLVIRKPEDRFARVL